MEYVFGLILNFLKVSERPGPGGGLATYTHTHYRLD